MSSKKVLRTYTISSRNTINGVRSELNSKSWNSNTESHFKGIISFNEDCIKNNEEKEWEILSTLRKR